MVGHTDPAAFDERIEAVTAALASSDARAYGLAQELVTLILEFHKAGLHHIVSALDGTPQVRARLMENPIVGSLLALHDLALAPAPPLLQISRRADHGDRTFAPRTEHPAACARCNAPLAGEHRHVVDVESRRLTCCCRACWLLAGSDDAFRSQRAVPDRYREAPSMRLSLSQWEALQIPVDVAFLMRNSVAARTIAFYPGPAGPTESALSLEAWRDVADANAWMQTVAPDVEALLIRRDRDTGGCSCFIVPIDACYELVGRIRLSWNGLTGGSAVHRAIDEFFADVSRRCGTVPSEP